MKKSAQFILVLFVFCCLLGGKIVIEPKLTKRAHLTELPESFAASYRTEALKKYTFGLRNFWASVLWVRLLQDASENPAKTDGLTWEYSQIEAITTLDPNFDPAFSFGAIYLSVFRRDNQGAKLILEKWARRRPTYWKANYLLAYHLFAEMGEFSEAVPYMLKAAALPGAPQWLPALGVRLLSETGGLMQSLKLSIELYESYDRSEARNRLARRIRSLNFALQKSMWEKALGNYLKSKKKGPTSLVELRPFLDPPTRELATLIEQNSLADDIGKILREKFAFMYDPGTHEIVSAIDLEVLDIEKIGIHRKEKKP